MLESFKRWVGNAPDEPDWRPVQGWAEHRGLQLKRTRDRLGFVVDAVPQGGAWRLEWGPPQRSYLLGHELRLRAELGLPAELQMLLMSRPLMEALERQTFERYTEQLQTQIDTSTPEEMRWLAMLPKVTLSAPREFRQRFGAVALIPRAAAGWIDGELAECLWRASLGPLAGELPLVLMTLRGRLYLRLQLATPQVEAIESAVGVFESAVAQAVRIGASLGDGPDAWPSTATTAWQTQLQPEPTKD